MTLKEQSKYFTDGFKCLNDYCNINDNYIFNIIGKKSKSDDEFFLYIDYELYIVKCIDIEIDKFIFEIGEKANVCIRDAIVFIIEKMLNNKIEMMHHSMDYHKRDYLCMKKYGYSIDVNDIHEDKYRILLDDNNYYICTIAKGAMETILKYVPGGTTAVDYKNYSKERVFALLNTYAVLVNYYPNTYKNENIQIDTNVSIADIDEMYYTPLGGKNYD